jgi:hypothetical protein
MPRSKRCSRLQCLATLSALWFGWALVGCGGDSVDVVPVSGQVMVDGEPLRAKSGNVTFVPDKAKGNTTTFEPSGYLDENGNYTLYYAQGKKGAPPGWYKIQVTASRQQGDQPLETPRPRGGPPPPPPLFNNKFTRSTTSGLEVEVVKDAAAGAYDLKLTK